MQKSTNLTLAVVRFTREGFHSWPDAGVKRAYLASPHRHLFHIEVQVRVFHDEREIEYHDLLDFCKEHFPGGDMGSQSCEMMARDLLEHVTKHFPGRFAEVHCFEDGEVGAIVSNRPVFAE